MVESLHILKADTLRGICGEIDAQMSVKGFSPARCPVCDTVVSDIVYNPLETPFLKRAKHAGLKTHDGAGMLVYQGAESFKLWTGVQPPVDVMRQAVLRALQEHH